MPLHQRPSRPAFRYNPDILSLVAMVPGDDSGSLLLVDPGDPGALLGGAAKRGGWARSDTSMPPRDRLDSWVANQLPYVALGW